VRRQPKGNAAAILCWTDLRNAIGKKTIFNNKQVTCVGARVVGKAMIEERPCAKDFLYKIDLEQGSALS
jgi:hypothetical protein